MALARAPKVYVQCQCRSLADLETMIQAIRFETRVANNNQPVADDSILLQTADTVGISFTLDSERLSDGSTVYNVTAT